MNTVDATSLEMLKEIIGDDLKEILLSFIETSVETLQQMKQALKDNNADNLKLHAHTLKGSSANIGATILPELSFKLENKGSEGIAQDLDTEILNVELELDNVNNFIKNYIKDNF